MGEDEMNLQPVPPQQPGQAAGPRPAGAAEQRMFETMARQALMMITSDGGARALLRLAKSQGPGKAIAEMVSRVLDGVAQAAQSAGVQVAGDVRPAVVKTVVTVLSRLLVNGGVGEDPESIAAEAMEMIDGGGAGMPVDPGSAQEEPDGTAG